MKNDEMIKAGEQYASTKGKRGSKSASIEATTTANPSEISEILKNNLYWYHREIVKDDDECADRLTEFFDRLAETGEIPTVEKMCLALGTVRTTLWNWENGQGCSSVRMNMIKKAKEILAALDAELVSRGKIPQITYIFRAKNFYQMSDNQTLTLVNGSPLGEEVDEAELRRRIQGSTTQDVEVVDEQ